MDIIEKRLKSYSKEEHTNDSSEWYKFPMYEMYRSDMERFQRY